MALGHLKTFGDFVKRNKPGAHPDMAIVAMNRALNRPPLMFMDLRPINEPMVVVGDYEIADQITKASKIFPTSPPKSAASLQRLLFVTGATSIFSSHGDEWKALRKRFNTGFSPQYLSTFVPEILDKGMIFLEHLDELCASQDAFPLINLTTRLTFDIIGKVVMEADLDALSSGDSNTGPLVDLFETLLDAYNGDRLNLPWWLTISKVKKRAALSERMTNILRAIVRSKHAELHETAKGTANARSVLSLALQDVKTLTDSIMDETCDQLRTFLFAGHDTTSILLSWAFYELSRTPHAMRAVRAELDGLLGTDTSPATIRTRLLGRSDLAQQMPYISAVIKETLRLHPPGGTARVIPAGSGFFVRMPSGEQQCLDGLLVYNCQSIIHRDPRAFGDTADDFVPERWLADKEPIPAGAWRPFERGPRNCIGMELANIEARIIIALTVRRYDFTKVGLGEFALNENGQPSLNEKTGQYKVTEELYSVTSKPADGMLMRVKLAE
ncbi:hypothetical protein PFICI_14981 [Pestalotiopsis fici W106-1]|uniref:Uncharacterized protein n=1 Tax=Pestalotiopsis fici (strain W106-1 / CGMCC3.15140) TaxID=1229662 RepID=W3WKN3_PESFW|nr:uncharacterized protein PFICI_14981 [Pestalotiopsis fici W106-1]ETS73376.1 hypothetical protein PFICI_14981 [Pestalotiopsis fici W106-1]